VKARTKEPDLRRQDPTGEGRVTWIQTVAVTGFGVGGEAGSRRHASTATRFDHFCNLSIDGTSRLFPTWERDKAIVQIIAKKALREFWEAHPRAQAPLQAWYAIVDKADWSGPADVKAMFRTVDFVGDNRAIFDIGGNKYRLVVHIAYRFHRVLIKFVGTHAEYDEIDPENVS
jgi:mRNA interferase HigB